MIRVGDVIQIGSNTDYFIRQTILIVSNLNMGNEVVEYYYPSRNVYSGIYIDGLDREVHSEKIRIIGNIYDKEAV